MTGNKIKVVLADDHHIVRAAVAAFLAKEPDIVVVGEIADATKLLATVEQLCPQVLLLDAHMPGHRVIEAAQTLQKKFPDLCIVIFSAHHTSEYVVGLLGTGAAGYVLKDDPPETLAHAIRAVMRGQRWLSPRVAEVLVKSASGGTYTTPVNLTKREVEVLQLMASGYKNEQIADELNITEQTVKNHVRSIFSKLGVESRVEAVLYAIKQGVLALEEGEGNNDRNTDEENRPLTRRRSNL